MLFTTVLSFEYFYCHHSIASISVREILFALTVLCTSYNNRHAIAIGAVGQKNRTDHNR